MSRPASLLAANSWVDVNARRLLAAKADVGAEDKDGKTALMLALQNEHADVAKLLTSAIGAAVPAQK